MQLGKCRRRVAGLGVVLEPHHDPDPGEDGVAGIGVVAEAVVPEADD
jgi:hypothetical protein